jgi:hypothetical protein
MADHNEVTERHVRQLRMFVVEQAAFGGHSELDVLWGLARMVGNITRLGQLIAAPMPWTELSDLVAAEIQQRSET